MNQFYPENHYKNCRLCPRGCGVDRLAGQRGYCGCDAQLWVARAALHLWEEPCISGEAGSGAVFFSGCSLGCVYCQNISISRGGGYPLTPPQLADIFLDLQSQGALNINLVTGAHYVPGIVQALQDAKQRGLHIPVVYNSSGYERVETLRMLEGLVDVYLPDLKYCDRALAGRLSKAEDYPETARAAIAEMVRQTGACQMENGFMQRGVIVRHLLLPGHVNEAKQVVKYLHETYQDRIYISLLNQYTPMPQMAESAMLPYRPVTHREYDRLVDYALSIGVENGFIQEFGAAGACYIPSFDGEGVKP